MRTSHRCFLSSLSVAQNICHFRAGIGGRHRCHVLLCRALGSKVLQSFGETNGRAAPKRHEAISLQLSHRLESLRHGGQGRVLLGVCNRTADTQTIDRLP
jgi:hypothetical protein